MKYKINHGFIIQKIDNKVMIFSGEESVLRTLNETAAYIFQKLRIGWENEKIVEGLVEKFGAMQKQAKEDLEDFIKLLLRKQILTKIK